MNERLNKILIVIFLTLLVWAWAYMSLEKSDVFTGTLKVAESSDPSLLVTFSLSGSPPRTEIPLGSIGLKGAPSKILELRKRLDHPNKERLDFYYDVVEQGREKESSFTLKLFEFLQQHSKIHELALSLTSCLPEEVEVHVDQLEKKKLPVQCLDEVGIEVPGAVPDPAFVNIYVRQGYNEPATITLTQQQIDLARSKQPVSVRPYVNLGVADVVREAEESVKVTIEGGGQLPRQSFQTSKPMPFGVIMNPEFSGQYKVTITNLDDNPSTTQLFATDEALAAYEKEAFPFLIEIKDSEIKLTEIPPKTIIYNFPIEFVKKGEIRLVEEPIWKAQIKIEEINPTLAR